MKVSHRHSGYLYVDIPGHPMADKRGRVLLHRLVMSEVLGRNLGKNEQVHHINGNPSDNRPENLEVVSPVEHSAKHPQPKFQQTVPCAFCGAPVTKTIGNMRGTRVFCSRAHTAAFYASVSGFNDRRPERKTPHGSAGDYRNGCRCELCTEANRIKMQKYRNKRRLG